MVVKIGHAHSGMGKVILLNLYMSTNKKTGLIKGNENYKLKIIKMVYSKHICVASFVFPGQS